MELLYCGVVDVTSLPPLTMVFVSVLGWSLLMVDRIQQMLGSSEYPCPDAAVRLILCWVRIFFLRGCTLVPSSFMEDERWIVASPIAFEAICCCWNLAECLPSVLPFLLQCPANAELN
ncbi:hypothetical protein Nepgr_023106 [Nepenthes gracilis]|uniref:Uncharacterized protein n=1 Tax=Nepenthes gracilis TaxID=150966 RepID=A0AAD3T271_NEPGR|nr:hypothetical protein Nepgr_023106 [Nepenthes gracilis]